MTSIDGEAREGGLLDTALASQPQPCLGLLEQFGSGYRLAYCLVEAKRSSLFGRCLGDRLLFLTATFLQPPLAA